MPIRSLKVFALLFFLKAGFCRAQIPDSVLSHIDSSLYILQENSLYSNSVDWPQVKRQVYQRAASAKTKAQTFEALRIAFRAIGDKHAAYYQYEDEFKIPDSILLVRFTDSIKAEWSKGPRIVNRMLKDIAYLNVPFMGVNTQADIDKLANWLYDAVAGLSRQHPTAWIIDLRLNGGGNIRPMLAGLAPFFEDGVAGYYIDRNGKATDEARFINGDFQIDGVTQATIKNKVPNFNNAKVAVLIGAGTASSGEGVAALFKQRKNTRLIGEPTAGRANATNGFAFNNNQSYFLISTAYLGDKHKQRLPEFVTPESIVENNDAFNDLSADNAVKQAMLWLR